MKNYHIYETKECSILFLTEYKQAFVISDEEKQELINKKNSCELLKKYFSKMNPQDCQKERAGKDRIWGLYLCVANTCNAMCTYCFANHGNYGKESGLMKKEVAFKAIDFFMSKVPQDCVASFIFFGGEPLLAYDIIENSCEYIKEKYCDREKSFHITTNGTLLSEKVIDYFAENDFAVGLSIDGNKEIHNKQRPLRNGKDSFTEATKNLEYLMHKVNKVVARGTYCDFSYDLCQCYSDLIQLGFREVNIVPDILDINNLSES